MDITREINAPRDLIHRAYTDPELLPQWLGPRGYSMDVEKWEVRDGGAWRYVQTDPDGNTWGFHGVFHGPQTPDQMIQTFEFEGVPGHVSFSELRLEENGGKTTARTHVVFMSLEDRDGMVSSGMETGVVEGYERLDELIAKLVPVADGRASRRRGRGGRLPGGGARSAAGRAPGHARDHRRGRAGGNRGDQLRDRRLQVQGQGPGVVRLVQGPLLVLPGRNRPELRRRADRLQDLQGNGPVHPGQADPGRPGDPDRQGPRRGRSTPTQAADARHQTKRQSAYDLAMTEQPHRYAAWEDEPVRTISREELKAKLDRGDDFKLIQALNRWAFDAKHIPGSLHFDTPEELIAAVHPDDEVVVYCSNVDCLSSVAMYRDLVRRGYDERPPLRGRADGLGGRRPADGGTLRRGTGAPVVSRSVDPEPRVPPSIRIAEAIEGERTGWHAITATVRQLTPDECMEPGYYPDPDWSVRDVIAHLGTWLAEAQVQLERLDAGTYEGHDIDIDAMNA